MMLLLLMMVMMMMMIGSCSLEGTLRMKFREKGALPFLLSLLSDQICHQVWCLMSCRSALPASIYMYIRTLHYIAFLPAYLPTSLAIYVTFCCVTLPRLTLRYIALRYITQNHTILHYTTPHFGALHDMTWHNITLHCFALQYIHTMNICILGFVHHSFAKISI